MGMFNAIIPDHALHACGVFKERLSQSALYAETMRVPDAEADTVRAWLEKRGMKFHTGPHHESDLSAARRAPPKYEDHEFPSRPRWGPLAPRSCQAPSLPSPSFHFAMATAVPFWATPGNPGFITSSSFPSAQKPTFSRNNTPL